MFSRGSTLVLIAVACIAAGAALKQGRQQANSAPTMIETVGSAAAKCRNSGIDTPVGRLGCANNANDRSNRRLTTSGAVFLQSGG